MGRRMGRRTERAGATMGATSERGLNTSHIIMESWDNPSTW